MAEGEAVQDAGGAPAPLVDTEAVSEVAPGVHVISDGRVPLVPNIGIVTAQGAALVVDAGMGPRNGAKVLVAARRLAGDDTLTLTTTHFHPEHAFGAQVFAGEARYVANRAQADELRAKGAAYIELFTTFGSAVAAELEGVEIPEPDETYDDELDLDIGGVTVQLRSWASRTPGATRSCSCPMRVCSSRATSSRTGSSRYFRSSRPTTSSGRGGLDRGARPAGGAQPEDRRPGSRRGRRAGADHRHA